MNIYILCRVDSLGSENQIWILFQLFFSVILGKSASSHLSFLIYETGRLNQTIKIQGPLQV